MSIVSDTRGSFLQLRRCSSPRVPAGNKGLSHHSVRFAGTNGYDVAERDPVSCGRIGQDSKWLALSRMMLWWMAPYWGRGGSGVDIPPETSFLLLRTERQNDVCPPAASTADEAKEINRGSNTGCVRDGVSMPHCGPTCQEKEGVHINGR